MGVQIPPLPPRKQHMCDFREPEVILEGLKNIGIDVPLMGWISATGREINKDLPHIEDIDLSIPGLWRVSATGGYYLLVWEGVSIAVEWDFDSISKKFFNHRGNSSDKLQ